MGAGRRIHELHRDAQRRAGLAQAPLHHVAGAKFAAHRANVHRFAAETPRGAARHDAQMGEPHEAHDDGLAEAVGQRFEVGVRATVLERQHRDPEPFVRTTGSGRCHPGRWLIRRRGAGKALQLLTEVVHFDRQVLDGLIASGRILRQTPAYHTLQRVGRNSGDALHLRRRSVHDLVQ
jgi:hypothetical protein